MATAAPKAPSSMVKLARWSLLGMGIFYGATRQKVLAAKEAAYREQLEKERPAKEKAEKAEKERKNRAELAYLAKETGVVDKGAKTDTSFKSDCGCSY